MSEFPVLSEGTVALFSSTTLHQLGFPSFPTFRDCPRHHGDTQLGKGSVEVMMMEEMIRTVKIIPNIYIPTSINKILYKYSKRTYRKIRIKPYIAGENPTKTGGMDKIPE